MHWILQNNLFNEKAYQELLTTLVRFELPFSIHKVIPFIGELVPPPELDTDNVICMGSYSLRHVSKENNWYPGVFDLEPFDFRVQLNHWKSHMLNHDSDVTTFEDCVFRDGLMFARPIHDSKVFAGKVMDREEFVAWQDRVMKLNLDDGSGLNNNTLVQVCDCKKIYSEHRFWVVKGEVITGSTYKIGDRVQYTTIRDPQYEDFVNDRIKEWEPLDAFVIDVADTPDGLKIVEINTLNSCGFYSCDMQRLVMGLEKAFNKPKSK